MTALSEVLADRNHCLVGFDQAVPLPAHTAASQTAASHTAVSQTAAPHTAASQTATSQTAVNSKPRLTHPWEWNPTLAADTRVCICSPAIRDDDPFRQRFIEAGVPIIRLHQAVDAVFQDSHQICVTGTHGKSTTTAMLAWIMETAGRDPGYFIGAKFQHSGRSGQSSKRLSVFRENNHRHQQTAVIESCEFNRSFHQLSPSTIVLTGLERDHFDCFRHQQDEDTAFFELLQKLPENGLVIYNSSCQRSVALVRQINRRSIACAMQSQDVQQSYRQQTQCDLLRNADFQVTDFHQLSSGIQFRIHFQAESQWAESQWANLPVFGLHNASNAANAIAAAVCHGVSLFDSVQALSSFPGIERRFQHRGSVAGMELIDDYAHHPTAIRTTLQAARKKYPKRQIRVCFEPHQLIRLEQLQAEFVDALSLADTVYVLPVLAARESASMAKCHQGSHKLIIRLRSCGTSAFFSPDLDHVVQTVDYSANPNAVLLTMGAGSTHLIHDKLIDRLRRDSVA